MDRLPAHGRVESAGTALPGAEASVALSLLAALPITLLALAIERFGRQLCAWRRQR